MFASCPVVSSACFSVKILTQLFEDFHLYKKENVFIMEKDCGSCHINE